MCLIRISDRRYSSIDFFAPPILPFHFILFSFIHYMISIFCLFSCTYLFSSHLSPSFHSSCPSCDCNFNCNLILHSNPPFLSLSFHFNLFHVHLSFHFLTFFSLPFHLTILFISHFFIIKILLFPFLGVTLCLDFTMLYS